MSHILEKGTKPPSLILQNIDEGLYWTEVAPSNGVVWAVKLLNIRDFWKIWQAVEKIARSWLYGVTDSSWDTMFHSGRKDIANSVFLELSVISWIQQ